LDREHNYFGVMEDGSLNNKDFVWDLVGEDCLKWIEKSNQ